MSKISPLHWYKSDIADSRRIRKVREIQPTAVDQVLKISRLYTAWFIFRFIAENVLKISLMWLYFISDVENSLKSILVFFPKKVPQAHVEHFGCPPRKFRVSKFAPPPVRPSGLPRCIYSVHGG
jgi:hypothetical protein